MSQLINYLGNNSYPSIVQQIAKKLSAAKSESFQVNDMIQKALVTMNESTTPMMDLREFTTNAEQLASTDATLAEILNFITKNVKSGDLNFLVNMAKEEHFKEMHRAGFPNVQDTIKEYESYFNEPSSVIEQAIKNGIFDKLKSNLMMDLKSSLVDDGKTKLVKPEEVIKLNENQILYNNNMLMYTPIGIRMEDVKNNRTLLLTESDVLTFSRETKEFCALTNVEIMNLEIPAAHKRMMDAIHELTYNPEEETFAPTLNWDFNVKIDSTGQVILFNESTEKEVVMDKKDLPGFLMESVKTYELNPGFNREAYLRDADNLVLLVENHSKLIKLDSLKTIRTLNENSTYVIVEPSSQKQPKLIAGSGLKETQLFESYNDLNNTCSNILGSKLTGLFESQIEIESQFNAEKYQQIANLQEEQNMLNESIKEVNSLIGIAEEGSPALQRLVESKNDLDSKLEMNLTNLNFYKNQHKLY